MPFSGGPFTPKQASDVRQAIAEERGNNEPFDLCIWGNSDVVAEYEAAGVTWLVEAWGPEDDREVVRGYIAEGPRR
jgi:hypothetical protein